MEYRYNIAALLWAIVCAGSAQELSTFSGESFSTQNNLPGSPDLATVTTNVTMTTTEHVVTMAGQSLPSVDQSTKPTVILLSESSVRSSTKSYIAKTTPLAKTTSKPTSCMDSRKKDFYDCFEKLGKNAMPYILNQKLPEFLDDLCDVNRSKPLLECIKRHFSECPDFLVIPQVTILQFGPYNIKDISYFSSIDQMCSCITGLACIQELIKIKGTLTEQSTNSPWLKMPNLKVVCNFNTARYIGCVRGNLRVCQSPLTKRYGKDFTNEDAADMTELHDFTKEHCDTINSEGFYEKYSCLEKASVSDTFKQCIGDTEGLPNTMKMCKMRECVATILEVECDANDLITLYIDAVNVYRRNTVKLLNKICSDATDISISIIAFIVAICIVVIY